MNAAAQAASRAESVPRSNAPGGDYAGWLPIRLFIRDQTLWVDWCYIGSQRLTRPFFHEDATVLLSQPFNQLFRRYSPIDELAAWSAQLERNQDGAGLRAIIGHVSRCGSTLVCQVLAELPTHRVISEPPMLDVLLNVRRRLPHVSAEQQVRWLQALVRVLGHSQTGESHMILKLDAWHVLEHAVFRAAFPDVPFVFMVREPAEVAVSHLQLPAVYMLPGAVSQMPWAPPYGTPAWTDELLYVAAVLGEIYRCGAEACSVAKLTVIDHSQLPDVVWSELRETLAVPAEKVLPVTMKKRATGNAKRPHKSFDARADQNRVESLTTNMRAAVEQACGAHYRRLRYGAVARQQSNSQRPATRDD